jgi:membrane-associated phospholipid phosphatase
MEDHVKSIGGYWIGASAIIAIGAIASLACHKEDFLIWLAQHRNPFLDYYFYYMTNAGEPIGFIVVGLLLLISSWRKMVFVPVIGLLSTVLTYGLKTFFYHERPALFLKRIDWVGPTDVLDYHMLTGHTSFPSGHSMAAWALFSFTAMVFRKGWVSLVCLFVAISVSLSRVYLMAHFLEDVVFGAVIGCLIAYGANYSYEFWMKKRS